MANRHFDCAMCGEHFEGLTPEEEALEEMERDFGRVPQEEMVRVCDDCYQMIRPDRHPDQLVAWKEKQVRGK